jgi:hypothetical protein
MPLQASKSSRYDGQGSSPRGRPCDGATKQAVRRRVALHNAPPLFVEFNKKTPVIPLGQVHDLNLLFETRRPVHIADAAGTADSPIVKYGGARTLVIVPSAATLASRQGH